MNHLTIALVLGLLAGCGNGDQAKQEAELKAAAERDLLSSPPPAPTHMGSAVADTPKAARPPEPEPTTPAEIDHARNQAMIDGRDKDVLHYCDLGKLDAKSNPQALLGCTLAACRIKDADTARRYAKPLAKAYLDQATRVCVTNQVTL